VFANSTPNFKIGSLPIYGDLMLAPMDGLTDQPFRSLARQQGAAFLVTEFINASGFPRAVIDLPQRKAFATHERPIGFQILGADAEEFLTTAQALFADQPDFFDVNLGCPNKSISGRGAGAGLLRTPHKIGQIIRALVQVFPVPITAKMRLGWDASERNYLHVARIIEESGASALTVHGRTKGEAYKGQADWDAIAEIRQIVKIPLIANGDIRSVEQIEAVKSHTGCDAVMIGRAAIGNPWIFQRRERSSIPLTEVHEIMVRHCEAMQAFYGPEKGLILFRKHSVRYLAPYNLEEKNTNGLLTTGNPSEFIFLLDQIFRLLDTQLALLPAEA